MLEEVPVRCGVKDSIVLYSKPITKVVNRSDIKNINKVYEIPEFINAPTKADDAVGKIRYMIGDKLLTEADVVLKEDIERATVWNLFIKALKSIVTG